MANINEFLLVKYGFQRRIEALKVCDTLNDSDRQVALEQIASLEAKGEITLHEAEHWRSMLFLPKEGA